jgi:hypothetical protein
MSCMNRLTATKVLGTNIVVKITITLSVGDGPTSALSAKFCCLRAIAIICALSLASRRAAIFISQLAAYIL